MPSGIAFGNGRLEADEIDIDTKFAGRIAQLLADEGDVVKAGQVVALMDTRDRQASLQKAAALVQQAQFTPNDVETKDERDKLMFRVRLRVDPALLKTRADRVRTGLPGVGYVRTDPAVNWPASLQAVEIK